MENTTIKYFAEHQATQVRHHIRNLYESDRDDRKSAFKKSEEFKALLKKINETKYAKELQADKEILLNGFDEIRDIYVAIKSNAGIGVANEILRLGNYNTLHWEEKSTFTFRLPETKHMSNDMIIYSVRNGNGKEEFEKRLDESISDRINSKASHKLTFAKNSWNIYNEIDAVVATVPASDLSQVIEKVQERLPMEEVNAVSIKEDKEEDSTDELEF